MRGAVLRPLLFVTTVAAVRGMAQSPSDTGFAPWEPVRIITSRSPDGPANPDTLVLRNGRRFTTGLYELRFRGFLPRAHGAPFLVLQGLGCTDCDAAYALYVVSPTDPPGPDRHAAIGYWYPGDMLPEDGAMAGDTTPVARSRAFLGRCLAQMTVGIVWFVATRDGTRWTPGVHVIDVVDDTVRERDLPPPLPEIRALLPAVRGRRCRELPP